MSRFLIMPIGLLIAMPAAADPGQPVLPAWMAGCWLQHQGANWTEECWTHPRGGMMLGHSRSGGADDRVSEWELMRIELDAQNGEGPRIRMGFFAAPQGRGWTTFAWSPDPARGVSFFNAANDYPQHIRYWREGKLLNAEISSLNGDNAKRWSFAPAPR